MNVFQTSMSGNTRWTGVLTILIVIVGVVVMASRHGDTYAMPLAGLLLVVLALAYAMSPLRYEVGDGQLVVRRQIGRTSASLRGATVELAPQAFESLTRLFGNGGFFAIHGVYYSRQWGTVHAYARNREHGVLLTLANGKRWLLSPDDPEAFIVAVRAQG